ncbi:MAG: hypothetical protein AB7K24_30735 [Gemmataceae bacterium]
METFYLICAAIGGTILVCQFFLSLMGGDHHDSDGGDSHGFDADHDVEVEGHDAAHDAHDSHDAHHGHSWLVGVLTFRTMVAGLTMFGLTGMASLSSGMGTPLSTLVALAAAAGAIFVLAWTMQGMHKLKADGTCRVERSVGRTGTVYLTVPGSKAGRGKVTVSVQNRTVEYQAITAHGEALPTGAKIVVVNVVSTDTVEVAPAVESERRATV